MKHFYRKPLLPILILSVLVFATCFLAAFQEGIRQDRAQVDGLYDNTILTVELLPAGDAAQQLRLQTHKREFLEALDPVSKILCVMECNGKVGDLDARIYGTNDHAWLARYRDLDVELWDGWDWSAFAETGQGIPCIVGTNVSSGLDVSLGDTITITPVDSMGAYTDKAPVVTMVVAGSFSDPTYQMDNGILVPEEIFLHGPRLLYHSNMMYDCFYRTFVMELNPAFNRDYEETEKAVEGIIFDLKEFELVSNYRTLRRAAGPLERKLALQEQLVLPLAVLFAVAAMTCTILLMKSLETEVFLRRMWGEKRICVFGKMLGTVILWLACCTLLSAAAAGMFAGRDWLCWAAGYAGLVSSSCVMAAAFPVGYSSSCNLVAFYQSKEVE